MKSASSLLTDAEKRRIIEAVERAERDSSAEIVVMVVSASHDYPQANLRGAVSLGTMLAALTGMTMQHSGMWTYLEWFGIYFILLYMAVSRFAFLRRLFLSRQEKDGEVSRSAILAFHSRQLHNTIHNTGVLLYISQFERKLHILADTGIASKIPQKVWDDVVKDFTRTMRSGQPCQAILGAVERCAAMVREHFPLRPDDRNELADLIIIERPWP